MDFKDLKKGKIYVASADNEHLFKFDRVTEYNMVLCSSEVIDGDWVYAGINGSMNMNLENLKEIRNASWKERWIFWRAVRREKRRLRKARRK